MPTAKSVIRRIGKICKWVLAGLTLTLLLLLLILHTGWGRDFAKDWIAERASRYPGALQIGNLEGSLLGERASKKSFCEAETSRRCFKLPASR